MKTMKRLAAFLLACALLLSWGLSESRRVSGLAHGNNGPVIVMLTLEGDRIQDITAWPHLETPGIGVPAVEKVAEAILEQQSLDVDAVAGATVSSRATVAAVENALRKAGVSTEKYHETLQGETIDKTTDVVIVGGGFAGMVSAVRAAQAGAKVILLERSGMLGGNARFAMGWISGAGFRIQKDLGVEDSTEQFYRDIIGFAGGEANLYPATAKYYAEQSGPAIDWLQENGAEFKNELNPGIYDPMSVLRVAWASHMGTSLTGGMQAQLDQLTAAGQVEILLGTNAEELLLQDGAVVGVRATDTRGDTLLIHAGATILASGGYEASEEKLSAMFEYVARSFMTASGGDTVDLAVQAGAATHDMDYNTVTGGVLPNDGFYSNIYMNTTYGGLIFVDVNGRRVFNETGARTLEKSNAWVNAPENTLYAILTEDMLEESDPILSYGNAWTPVRDTDWAVWKGLCAHGSLIYRADTLEELSALLGMPALVETVAAYNGYAESGTDEDFGRTERLLPLKKGPFLAVKTIPYCGWASGGPMANKNMEVLREDGSPIPGLYVAGEGAGHTLVAGRTPISGMYLGMCATFGIDAAEHAAAYALK